MKVTQEKLPDSQIGLEIEISGQSSQQRYDEVLKNLARTANIPGFRKGKVPRPILIQRLGSRYIKAAALETLIQKSIQEAFEQEAIAGIGDYQLRSNFEELVQAFVPGQPLVFSAAIDVQPTVELGDYQSLSIQAEEVPYKPESVEEWLKERQEKQSTLVPVEDRPAQMGDVAIVDYQAYADEGGSKGEAISGVQGTDFNIDLDEGRFVEGMIEGIVGMGIDEQKDVTVVFPEDYPREDLANKSVIFDITLKDLKVRELPELDDDFAEEVSEFTTMAELRASLEKQFQEEARDSTQENVREAIIKALIGFCTVELPNTLIQEEVSRILTRTAMQFEQMGIDLRQLFTPENIPVFRENARTEAIDNIKQVLILKAIATREAIEPDPAEVQAKITRIKADLPAKDIDLARLEAVVNEETLTEQVLAWLQEKTQVELVAPGTLTPEAGEEDLEAEVTADGDDSTLESETELTTIDVAATPEPEVPAKETLAASSDK